MSASPLLTSIEMPHDDEYDPLVALAEATKGDQASKRAKWGKGLYTKRELPPVEMLAASDDGQMTSRKGCVGDTKSFWHARAVATSSKLKREMDPKQHFVTFHHINTTASLLVEMEQMRKEMVAMRSELATLRIESILGKRKSDDR